MATEPGGSTPYYDDWLADADAEYAQHVVGSIDPTEAVTRVDGRTVLVCVAVVLSAGALIRALVSHQAKDSSAQHSSKSNKKRDSVVKKIIAQQQQQRQANGGTTTATTSQNRPIPGKALSYANDLLTRFSSLWSGNAAASTSAVKLDSTSDSGDSLVTTKPEPSPATSRRSSTTATDVFSSSISRRQSVEHLSTRKGKGRAAGKTKTPPSATAKIDQSRTTSPGPEHSPRPAPPKVSKSIVPVVDVAVQASFPLADEDDASRSRSTIRQRSISRNDSSTCEPALLPPPTISPPRAKPVRASSPEDGLRNSSRRSSAAEISGLHATFQATTGLAETLQISPTRSPEHAPSESSRRGRSAQSSPTLHPSSAEPSSKSRKQARKASANANSPGRVVVGLHRLVRDRDPTDDSEAGMLGYNGAVSSSAFGSADMSRSASASSGASAVSNASLQARSARLEAVASLGQRPSSVPIGKHYESYSPMSASNGLRRSPTPGGESSSRSESSSSTSPFFGANRLLMTSAMLSDGNAISMQRRGSWNGERAVEDEAFWRERVAADHDDSTNVGLAIELDERGPPTGDRASSSTGSRKDGSTGDSSGARAGSRSWSSADGSPPPSMPSLIDSYFPPSSQTALTTPDSSPHPANRKLLSMSTASAHKQWQAMSPIYPIRSSNMQGALANGVGRQAPPPPVNGGAGQMRATGSSASRQPSRQPSLSLLIPPPPVPPPPPPPIPAGLTPIQQQAYAQMYAQAQSQYQHMIALQYQAQQIHQRQQQIAVARQRLEMEQGVVRQPSSPGLVYPISSSSVQTPLSAPMSSAYWGSNGHHGAYSQQYAYGSLSQTASPTVQAFPHGTQHLSGGGSPAYYGGSYGHHLGNGIPPASPNRPPSMRSASSFTPISSIKRADATSSASPASTKRPQRPPHLRTRSASATATLSTTSLAPLSPLDMGDLGSGTPSPTGKGKGKSAEIESDRAAKELEIARWRVSVLEEEQRLNDLENQEALRVLAARAMRAEARIKMLEGNTQSSMTGGTISEVYHVGMTVPLEEWQPDSPSSAKIHPLSWLDLDTVSFSTRPQASPVKSPPFLNPSHRRRSGRGSRRSRRKSAQGSATQPAPPSMTVLNGGEDNDDDDEEEVLIVLDTPRDRRASGASSLHEFSSRSPSFVAVQDDYHEQPSPMQEANESFISDRDELDDEAEDGPAYIGSLPTFLQPPAGRSSRSPSLSNGSPSHGSARDGIDSSAEDEPPVSVRRGMPDLSLDVSASGVAPHKAVGVSDTVPMFQFDCATPDSAKGIASTPLETIMASPPSSDSSPTGSIESSTTMANNTPRPPAASSPTESDDGVQQPHTLANSH
ncbi:hypothetical protein OIV83_002049 [Microbotryomycetes sp. JL201]|nr:hypothetical protein OIV83_002049 [Microbotryomycetes sp. JL201]